MASTLVFYGQFVNAGQGATGLTVTVDVVRITRSDGTQTTVVTGGSATEVTTPIARGVYLYRLANADLTLYDYIATFITSGTVTQKHIPAVYTPVMCDTVWDEVLTGSTHNVQSSAGRRLRQVSSIISEGATVNDAAATATTFITTLTSSVDDFYNDQLLIFTSGALAGSASPILDYVGTTKTVTVAEPFTSAPANGLTFDVQATHIHPTTQIADAVLDRTLADVAATTLRQAVKGFIATLLGKASGLPTAPKYRDRADTKDVVSGATDTNGNRTSVTLDLT